MSCFDGPLPGIFQRFEKRTRRRRLDDVSESEDQGVDTFGAVPAVPGPGRQLLLERRQPAERDEANRALVPLDVTMRVASAFPAMKCLALKA